MGGRAENRTGGGRTRSVYEVKDWRVNLIIDGIAV